MGIRGDLDVWVVDVENKTYVVVANEVGDVPQAVRDEQAGVLSSVEFVIRTEAQRRRTERRTPTFSMRCSGLWNSSDQKLPAAWSSNVAQVDSVIIARVGSRPGRPGTAADCARSDAGERNDVRCVRTTS